MANDVPDERVPLLQDDLVANHVERNGQLEDQLTTNNIPERKPTPLPLRTLTMVMLLTAMPPIVFEIIFPFINQMILEVGIVTDAEQVGFYSGLVESVFSVMNFLAGMFFFLEMNFDSFSL